MRVLASGIAVVAVFAGLFLLRPGWLANADRRTYDVLTSWAGPGKASGQVVILDIDEQSLDKLGRWPWPRDRMAALVERTFRAGASVLVLDIMYPEQDRPRDEVLAGALAMHPTVTGYSVLFDGSARADGCTPRPISVVASGEGRGALPVQGFLCSVPAIAAASRGSGFLNAAPDADGRLRRLPLIAERDGQYFPSLSLAARQVQLGIPTVKLGQDEAGARQIELGRTAVAMEGPGYLRLRYRGPRNSIPHVSAADLFGESLPADALRGKIVTVGASALGVQDRVPTPLDTQVPGIEVQATAIDNLIAGDVFHRPGNAELWEILSLLVAGAVSAALMFRARLGWGISLHLALMAVSWVACYALLVIDGVLLSPLPATSVVGVNCAVLMLFHYQREKRRADRTEQSLVSTRESARDALRESEERYRRLVENVSDAIIVSDRRGQLVFANRRFREWFGVGAQDLREVNFEDSIAAEWREPFRQLCRRQVEDGPVQDHLEFEGVRADGERIWIEAVVTPVEENGAVTGTQAALRDITARKRQEEEFAQAQKMETLGRLAGGVAHDFNNLLTVISGYAHMMADGLQGDEWRDPLEQIMNAAQKGSELTGQLLAFSRKQVVRAQPVDLNLIVGDTAKMLARVIGENIELVLKLAPKLDIIRADAGQMSQVLLNLATNARDAMPDHGRLTIVTENVTHAGQPCVLLTVSDTGVGMDAKTVKQIFEPFFTTKAMGRGTGLGLATVYGIVNRLGGSITVFSKPGIGSTFRIYLPAEGEKVEEGNPPRAHGAGAG